MKTEPESIRVEVAVAWPELQVVIPLEVESGATVGDAIERSGLGERFPSLEIDAERIGVFANRCRPDRELKDGDRVEIYRPLRIDPKTARRMAAEASRQG